MWFNSTVNVNGIETIDSTNVSVGTDAVTITFRPSFNRSVPFRGLLLARINSPIPEGTTTTLPIVFSMNGFTDNVTTYGGTDWLVEDFRGTGIYLLYYNRAASILLVLTAA